MKPVSAAGISETVLCNFNSTTKRTQDLLLTVLFLPIVIPIMTTIAIVVWLTSGGPIICRQWRHGLNGEPFIIYKFRTMTCCDDGNRAEQTLKSDPRITGFGYLLRKSSLDELPQFINVLRGQMSIVGPRPHTVAMNEEYQKIIPGYMLRHIVKPGITGLAAINGWLGPTDTLEKMKKRIQYDMKYIEECSLILDLKIIMLTILKRVWWRIEE